MRGIVAAVALGLVATTAAAAPKSAQEKLDRALKGRVAGEPTNCISADAADGPQIIGDRTILYRQGARLWRNDLPHACPFLKQDRILVVELYGSNLCSNDTVSVIERGGLAIPIGKCRLGKFTPYTKVK